MTTSIRSKIVKIGNSRGILIPRTLLDQAGLSNEVELTIEGNNLIIHSANNPRNGWAAKFKMMAEQGDDKLLDQASNTQWDDEGWEW